MKIAKSRQIRRSLTPGYSITIAVRLSCDQSSSEALQAESARIDVQEEKIARLDEQFKRHELMIEHELDEAHQELACLRTLVFAPSRQNQQRETWKERAEKLAIQLDQLQPEARKDIRIDWMADEHDCETCGASWAEGAVVWLNGEVLLDLSPVAACHDGTSYSSEDVFGQILGMLGYSVSSSGGER